MEVPSTQCLASAIEDRFFPNICLVTFHGTNAYLNVREVSMNRSLQDTSIEVRLESRGACQVISGGRTSGSTSSLE